MPDHTKHPDLELDEALKTQELFWIFQRAAWIVLLLLVLAALLGLCGRGPLSSTVVATPDGLIEIEHNRFGRQQTPETLRLRAGDRMTNPTVWLSHEFLEAASLETIVPEPAAALVDSQGLTLRFDAASPAHRGSIIATIDYRPHRIGSIRASIGSSPNTSVSIWRFVYP